MPLIGFSVFREKLLSGQKTQTIRKFRKKPITLGDTLYLYWHLRQKDCEKLGTAVCSEVFTIRIDNEYSLGKQRISITTDRSVPDTLLDKDEIIHRDGFENADEMLTFFSTHYPLPEVFQVIRWNKIEVA